MFSRALEVVKIICRFIRNNLIGAVEVLKKKQVETAESAAYSIPQAGAMVALSRNGAYDAARRGEIPVMEFGRKKIVPKAVWDRMLGLAATSARVSAQREVAA
jgi:hypothetical protein